jgi:hypothetical protein
MTSHTTRYGLRYALAIAMMAAVAVVGSVWAKGGGQDIAMAMDGVRIDVMELHTSADIANMPVHNILDAI